MLSKIKKLSCGGSFFTTVDIKQNNSKTIEKLSRNTCYIICKHVRAKAKPTVEPMFN